jgi:3-hydroxyisobutyrate dehydrogenase-like beta-hydroxyacid dehydrogenase
MSQTIGVIGAGQMGAGIAQVSAQAGYRVLLSDISLEAAAKGRDGITKALARLVEKEKITTADRDAAAALIEPVASVTAMADAGSARISSAPSSPMSARCSGRTRSWLRTRRQSRLPGSRRDRPIPSASLACTSSIRYR